MAQASRPRLTSMADWGAGAAGLAVAVAAALLPGAWLEDMVLSSGIAAVLSVAAPPLGVTARAVLALGGGAAVAAVCWAALYLLVGPGGPLARRPKPVAGVPTVRRADAHPDAPPRRPLSADDLPVPPAPAVHVERAVPADLDVPLAAFDPDALPPVPLAPVRALKPLAPTLLPGERLETFTLTPPPPSPASSPAPRANEAPSIDALLRRLEQGARRRTAGAC